MSFFEDFEFYEHILEPILALFYIFLIVRITRSSNNELKTPFYTFFAWTGMAAVLNLMCTLTLRSDTLLPMGTFKSIACISALCFSHIFSFAHTLGKILTMATRYTAICHPVEAKNIWKPMITRTLCILQYIIPLALYAFILFQPPLYRETPNGIAFGGIDSWAMLVSKSISVSGYLLFFMTCIPMGIRSMIVLHAATKDHPTFANQERALLYYTVTITVAHILKSAQQIFWLFAIVMGDQKMASFASDLYNVPNILTTFTPPILLLFTSKQIRPLVTFGYSINLSKSSSTMEQSVSFKSTTSVSTLKSIK